MIERQKKWECGTWQGAEQSRREIDQRLTFRQKLEWNAQALSLALRFEMRDSGLVRRLVRRSSKSEDGSSEAVDGCGTNQKLAKVAHASSVI